MSSLFCRTALFVFAIGGASLAMPVQAFIGSDGKTSSGAVCQPYSSTTLPSELSFRAHGLKNISSQAEYVVCNVLVDSNLDRSPSDEVMVNFHAPQTATPRCELYVGSNLVGTPVSTFAQQEIAAGQSDFLYLSGLAESGADFPNHLPGRAPATLYCRMPPGSSIISIVSIEVANTDEM